MSSSRRDDVADTLAVALREITYALLCAGDRTTARDLCRGFKIMERWGWL